MLYLYVIYIYMLYLYVMYIYICYIYMLYIYVIYIYNTVICLEYSIIITTENIYAQQGKVDIITTK